MNGVGKGHERREFHIYMEYTAGGVYITKRTDISGLVLETTSLVELKQAVYSVVPELLASNLGIPQDELENIVVQVFLSHETTTQPKRPRILIEESPQIVAA